jgi:hypothetical protein
MAGPTSVRNVTVTLDGVTHSGAYYVQGSLVHVRCDAGTKADTAWQIARMSVAKLLLSELVRGQLKAKGK